MFLRPAHFDLPCADQLTQPPKQFDALLRAMSAILPRLVMPFLTPRIAYGGRTQSLNTLLCKALLQSSPDCSLISL
jgi:hypothetical protein